MPGVDHALFVATRNEHQRAVELVHLVEKNRDIHRALSWHEVVVFPCAVVLMPLPHIALKRHLAVDFELVHVELFAEQVLNRLDHARMTPKASKRRAVHMRGEVGAHGVSSLFTYVVVLLPRVELGHGIGQRAGFVRRE